jgi:two-component system LytT family sensor kinase
MNSKKADDAPGVPHRVILIALTGFWGFFVAINTARAALLTLPHQGELFERRIVVAALGTALGWLMYRVLAWISPSSLSAKIGWTAAMSLVAGNLFSTTNFLMFYVIAPVARETCRGADGMPCTLHDEIVSISDQAINWSFVFAAWGMLYLSLVAAAEMRTADQRAAAHREAARLAEIRALRYQINPHFLFNLLNGLSTLVIRRELPEAEALIGEIGRFFRYSLAADPVADSGLGDEIEMQARYLELERRRFPNRLHTRFEVPDAVTAALTPSLILQPIVENAIKHGVGRTSLPVTVSIRATQAPGGKLRIVIEDDARPSGDTPAPASDKDAPVGMGIGLKNVGDRLRARFGADASCSAGPRADGGYRVELLMPLILG